MSIRERRTDAYDVVIVGGGVAGLVAAWELRDEEVLLLESSDRLGGHLMSSKRGDYWLNSGAHLFPGPGSRMRELIDELGLESIGVTGNTNALVMSGTLYAPDRLSKYLAVLPMSMRERLALAWVGFRVWSGKSWRRRSPQALSARSGRQLIGRQAAAVSELFDAAARRAGVDLDQQSARTTLALFDSAWGHRKGSLSQNIRTGPGGLIAALSLALGDRCELGVTVTGVEQGSLGPTVRAVDEKGERIINCRQVILAVPAPAARDLFGEMPQKLADTLASISYGSFVTLGIITDETVSVPWDGLYAAVTPGLSFNMFFNHANPVHGSGHTKTGSSLMVYAGGTLADRMMAKEDAEIQRIFLDDLIGMFPALAAHVRETRVQRWPRGISSWAPGISSEPLREYGARQDTTIRLCGDYFGDLGNMENAARSATDAAQMVAVALR